MLCVKCNKIIIIDDVIIDIYDCVSNENITNNLCVECIPKSCDICDRTIDAYETIKIDLEQDIIFCNWCYTTVMPRIIKYYKSI